MPDQLQHLRRALRNNNLVPVIGSGFSTALAGLPSWSELLTRAIEYIADSQVALHDHKQIEVIKSLAASNDLLDAFGYFQKILSSGDRPHYDSLEYEGFLYEVFHNLTPAPSQLASALKGLRSRVVLTTNYDLLIEQSEITSKGRSETWLDPSAIRTLLRSGSGVVHLHGRYDIPSSVILSTADYGRLVTADDATTVAQAAFHSGVLLFIGSSIDGISDPHLGRLLEEFSRITDRTRREEAPHVEPYQKLGPPPASLQVTHTEPYQKLGPPPASLQVTRTVARVSDKARGACAG